MNKPGGHIRAELLDASDEQIDSAVRFADPMTLRGLLFQLTADPEVARTRVRSAMRGYIPTFEVADEADAELLMRKAAQFLKQYRDAGAGPISSGPPERLARSLGLAFGEDIDTNDLEIYVEELGLDPWARGLKWQAPPDAAWLDNFTVAVIGAGMAGLNMAAQLKKAGIKHTVFEKNAGVGGTWHENRYPGARVDTPSRSYTHIFGVDFGYPNPYCEWHENERYFNWIADNFGLRDNIVLETEVSSLTWHEDESLWQVDVKGPDGPQTRFFNAVVTGVGFLNRPSIPEIEGADLFKGQAWHTARWPHGFDHAGKRFAVIGTGCSGYQLVPELARTAGHVTVFQRTPQWLFGAPGYLSPFPPEVNWLDCNLPYYTNFLRVRASSDNSWFTEITTVDPSFDDPISPGAMNKAARESCISFLEKKLRDRDLVRKMTPDHPIWSARPVACDPDYNVLDAIQLDHVDLVTSGIRRITETGIEDNDGVHHEVDVIVYATGFKAAEYLYPMKVTGRNGRVLEEFWAQDGGGARGFLSCMVPAFPNMWMLYGPNTNGALRPAGFHETVGRYAMQLMERMMRESKTSVDVTEEAYWRYNNEIDDENASRVWRHPRAGGYYAGAAARTAVMNPLTAKDMWRRLSRPDLEDLTFT